MDLASFQESRADTLYVHILRRLDTRRPAPLLGSPHAGSRPVVRSARLAAGTSEAQSCAHWDPLRQPFFGDVHVHTRISFDAWLYGVRGGPRDAYRFARGDTIGLPPYDAIGNPTRVHQLRAPLDFAAVTDHAELFGEGSLCTGGTFMHPACAAYGSGSFNFLTNVFGDALFSANPSRHPMCGANGSLCTAEAATVWEDTRLAAAEFDDPDGDCGFSTFVGFEWTAMPDGVNMHRNVLFRTEEVPDQPLSYVEAPSVHALWNGLLDQCAEVGPNCQALTIPHNSNFSLGQSLLPIDPGGAPLDAMNASLANLMEPLVELTQHKGDSECRPGAGTTDELCDFEKMSFVPATMQPLLSFARNALKTGLAYERQLGVNPMAFGLISSSDTHNGTPGATTEDNYPGHAGTSDGSPRARLSGGWSKLNPGGLIVLWAEENTRASLFDAMRRREAYSTSGTRPALRFFGGFDLTSGLCDAPDLASRGYAEGVPMGGQLESAPNSSAPRFVVHASQDPGTPGFPGTPLAEMQIVKGWIDDQGVQQESVTTISGGSPAPSAIDPLTCQTGGSGAASLCAQWQDPDFDPDEHAFYYVRVLESPTCRWSQRLCLEEGIDCGGPVPEGFEACCDGSVPETIQERAVSSPIWLRPAPEPGFGGTLVIGAIMIAAHGRRRTIPRFSD